MYFSQQQVLCSVLLTVGVAIGGLGGCTPLGQSANIATDGSSSTPSSPVSGSPSTPPQTETPTADTTNSTAKEKFATILGTKQDGWLPKLLAGKGLKKGLTPAATGTIIPGAEQVSEFGFSKVAVDDIPGLKDYEFYYAKDSNGKATQLESVKLQFDPALNQAYSDLVEIASNKYGAVKPEDVEQQTIVWVGSGFVTAQITKPLTNFDGYVLNVSLESQ